MNVPFITGIFDAEKGGGGNDPFQIAAGPFFNHELRVLDFKGREAVNDVYSYEVTVATTLPPEVLDGVVFGDPACLTIKAPGHEPRVIQGLVCAIEALDAVPGEEGGERRRYCLEIVPRLWLLKLNRENRVFENKTVKEIVEVLLKKVKIISKECNWRLRDADYPKLPFVYKKNETDYDFFRRILSEAGIFFFFEHASGLLDTLLPGAGGVANAVGGLSDAVGGAVGDVVGTVGKATKMLTILNFGDEAGHTAAVQDMALAHELGAEAIKRGAALVGLGKVADKVEGDASDTIGYDSKKASADVERVWEFKLKKRLRPKALRLHERDTELHENWAAAKSVDAASIAPSFDPGIGIGSKGPTLNPKFGLGFDVDAPAIPESMLRQQLYQVERSLRLYAKSDQRAERELERLRRGYLVAKGKGDCRRFGAAYRVTLDGHPTPSLNREYTVVVLEVKGVHPDFATDAKPVYKNKFWCIPANVAPRPHRLEAPILGPELARVVCYGENKGASLNTNKRGYVQIRFRWDIADDSGAPKGDLSNEEHSNAVCVPATQSWLGDLYGAQFVPREGMEVLVAFLEHQGNRPIILGCVPSEGNKVPFEDHQKVGIRSQTRPEDGGHSEISIDDRGGQELLHLRAARDLSEEILHDRTSHVANDCSTVVDGQTTHRTHKDFEQSVGGNHHVMVEDSAAMRANNNYEIFAGGSLLMEADSATTTVSGDAMLAVRGSRSIVIGEPGQKMVDDRHVYGISSVGADDALHFRADKEISFTIGKGEGATVFKLTPDGITMKAKNVALQASSRVVVSGAGPSLALDKRATLLAKNVTIASEGATIDLGSEATVQGKKVLIKTGSGSGPSKARKAPPPGTKPFTPRLLDGDGSPIAGKTYHLFFGDERVEGTTDGDGILSEHVPEDLTVCEVLVWLDTYPEGERGQFIFHLEDMPPHDTAEGARARLHALGYDVAVGENDLNESMSTAVRRFQYDHADTHNLSVTGVVDQDTIDAIRAVFGS